MRAATWRRAVLVGLIGVAALASPALAAAVPTPLQNVQNLVCTVANLLRGPIGMGAVVVGISLGGIMMAVGGRQSVGLMMGSLIGAAIIAGATALMSFMGATYQC